MFNSPGAICEQFVKCGKVGCRCNSGELHGPYHYLFYRDDLGRLRKRYVKRADVSGKRAELATRKASDAALKAVAPPKRARNHDLLTTIAHAAMIMRRAPSPRDKAGRFVKS